jgi:hypothetical protein
MKPSQTPGRPSNGEHVSANRNYTKAMTAVKAARAAAKTAASKAIGSGFKEIFDSYPTLQSIGWRQYTPYFCDGDPCEFSVHADAEALFINGRSSYSDEDEDEDGQDRLPEADADAIADEAADFLDMFEPDDLKALYGDHVRVTVNRDGKVKTDDYEHD